MDTIEKRASEKFPVCTCDKEFEEEYFKPQRDFYIKVATEQREIDIQRAIVWLKDNTVRNAFIDDNGLQDDDWQNSFIQAMKGE